MSTKMLALLTGMNPATISLSQDQVNIMIKCLGLDKGKKPTQNKLSESEVSADMATSLINLDLMKQNTDGDYEVTSDMGFRIVVKNFKVFNLDGRIKYSSKLAEHIVSNYVSNLNW